MNIMQNEKLAGVRDVIIEKDCAWFIADSLNWLLKYNRISNALELEAAFPKSIGTEQGAFSKIVKVGNEIYFSPLMSKDAYCYNLDEKIFRKLNFPLDECRDAKNVGVAVCGKNIYFLNRFPDMVIKVDSVTKDIMVFKAENERYLNQGIESKIYRGYLNPEVFDNKIFWMSYNNILNIFDMGDESFYSGMLKGLSEHVMGWTKEIFDEELKDWIIGVKAFQSKLWLLSYDGSVYQYDGRLIKVGNGLFDDYKCESIDGIVRGVFPDIFALENELWFIPQYKKKCIRYCADSGEFEKVLDVYLQDWDTVNREYVGCKVMGAGKILLYSYHESHFYILDTIQNTVQKKEIRVPFGKYAEENEIFRQDVIKGNRFIFDDLEYFLKNIGFQIGQSKAEESTVGKQIYAYASAGL